MDALYDNLDNYNESKLIEELRNENQELKAQIEKYTVTLGQIQKDFDKLAAEYKKLELNYSSLLKTARAEVERKTQIITNLNIEKDMMVLNAIQNKNISNVRKNWSEAKANRNKGNVAVVQNKKMANQPKSRSSSAGRKEDSITPTEDTCYTVSTENINKQNVENEKYVKHISDAKENVGQQDQPCKPASIKDRRKPYPTMSFSSAKFSSDEEGEIFSPVLEKRRNPVSNEKDSWRNPDRFLPKGNPLDHDHYSRNRNYDNDKYQSRDRFQSQRHRFSPDKFHHRSKRGYSGDPRFSRDYRQQRDGSGGYRSDKDVERSHRDGPGDNRHYRDRSGDHRPYRDNSRERPRREEPSDHKPRREETEHKKPELRKRRLESPAGDKFQQYQQKNHEEFERDYNDERNKYLEDLGNSKYHSDYNMPSNKRMRTNSCHRNDQDKCFKGQVLDQAPQPAVGSIQSEDMSCKSPDYLSSELASVPKEIKFDAEVKIDDPREHSNKYTIRTENGDKVLTTVVGRKVDLKPVNKSVWNIIEVEIPIALARRPSQNSEDRITEVYGNMDIDNPTSDLSSIESGETMSSLYDISTNPFHYEHLNVCRRNEEEGYQKSYDKSGILQAEKVIENPKSIKKVSTKIQNVVDVQETSIEKNFEQTGAQKVIKAESSEEYTNTFVNVDTLAEKDAEEQQINENLQPKIGEKETEKNSDSKESSNVWKGKYKIPKLKNKEQSGSREGKLSDDKHAAERFEVAKHANVSLQHKFVNKSTIADTTDRRNRNAATFGKCMVEGDLEISDESSDVDLVKRVMGEIAEQSYCQLSKTTATKNVFEDSKNEDAECIIDKSISNNARESNVDLKLSEEDKTKSESGDISKKGSKSKHQESKQNSIEKTLKNPEKDIALSKHSNPKLQETQVPKDMKSKFSDLFGDNSNLITPEDLGLTTQEVRMESSSSNYFPIFEDAQDAADLGDKVDQTKTDLLVILEGPHFPEPSKNTDQNRVMAINENITHTSKSNEMGVHNDDADTDITYHEPQESKSMEKEHDVKPTEKENVSKRVEVYETKIIEKQQFKKVEADLNTKSKSSRNAQKVQHYAVPSETNEIKLKVKHTKTEAEEMKSKDKHPEKSKSKHDINELDELKIKHTSSKNTEKCKTKQETKETKTKDTCRKPQSETEKRVTPLDANQSNSNKDTEKTETNDAEIKTTEHKKRKSRRHEEISHLTIDTGGTPEPAVITVESIKTALPACDKSICNTLNISEREVVKTVIISTGVQPTSAQENMPVNIISPILDQPVTPNIDSRHKLEIPMQSHSVHIHALATSTPAKEMHKVEDVISRTPDVSNTSNDQNSVSNNIVDSQNDIDAPDVRIFVKRRRRVVKKTTP